MERKKGIPGRYQKVPCEFLSLRYAQRFSPGYSKYKGGYRDVRPESGRITERSD